VHTSASTIGQVYVPWVNRVLLLVVVGLVLGFGSSSALASAYGVSVTGTMLITSVLLLVIARERWHLPVAAVVAMGVLMIGIDALFLSANLVKFADGGWFPLALGIVVFTLMRTWRRGRELLVESTRSSRMPLESLQRQLERTSVARVSGTAIFLTASNGATPLALLHNLKHNKVLHQRNILLTVETVSAPRAEGQERFSVLELGNGFLSLTLRFGFMEDPNVPRALRSLAAEGMVVDMSDTTFFASRETVVASAQRGMPLWRDKLFMLMSRNTVSATTFFSIPGNRLVELGTEVEI
jgi:KUP system potassium uptake protein